MVTKERMTLRSRINKFFTPELQRELEEMIFYEYGRDNNAKAKEIFNIIRRVNPGANAAAETGRHALCRIGKENPGVSRFRFSALLSETGQRLPCVKGAVTA